MRRFVFPVVTEISCSHGSSLGDEKDVGCASISWLHDGMLDHALGGLLSTQLGPSASFLRIFCHSLPNRMLVSDLFLAVSCIDRIILTISITTMFAD